MRWQRRSVFLVAAVALVASVAGSSRFGSSAGAVDKPLIAISDVSRAEGATGANTTFSFTVTVTDPSGGSAHGDGKVAFFTTDASAHAPTDYTAIPSAPAQKLDIVAGTDTYAVAVAVIGNAAPEIDKTFSVTLASPSSGFQIDLAHASATGTILNDDGSGTYSVVDSRGAHARVTEGNSGTTSVAFTVTRAEASVAATVPFLVSAPDGATPGTDYTVLTSSPVHFAAGATQSEAIVVSVIGDVVAEPDESVVVTLGVANPAQTGFAQRSDSLVIANDDSAVAGFLVADSEVQAPEGASSTTTPMVFTVTRTDSTLTSTVDYTITDAGAGANHASCTTDFYPSSLAGPDPNCETVPYHGTLTFAPGATRAAITVDVVGDDLPEGNQVFNVDLTNFVNTGPGTPPDYALEAHGTILNDDGVGQITLGPAAAVSEGGTLVFTLARTWGGGQVNPPVEQDTTIPWLTDRPGCVPGSATPGSDFSPTSGQVAIAAGAWAVQVSVHAGVDSLHEGDETVHVCLAQPLNASATLGTPSSQLGVVHDHSVATFPTVTAVPVGALRHAAFGSMTFAVALSSAPGTPVRIAYETRQTAGLNAAIADRDFRSVKGYIDFAQGDSRAQQTKEIKFLPQGSHKDEVFDVIMTSLTPGVTFKASDGRRSASQTTLVTIAGEYKGFRVFAADGSTFDYDGATHLRGCNPNCGFIGDVIGMSPTPDQKGFWLATTEGRVYTRGTAHYFGGLAHQPAGGKIRAIAAAPDGLGYWLLGADGGVFSFGSAHFYGGLGGLRLNAPATSIVPSPSGHGYWIVATDGGIFAFGDAGYFGSFRPSYLRAGDFVTAMARTSDGKGYWVASGSGGVYSFGDARYAGNAINRFAFGPTMGAVVAISPTSDDRGYVTVTSDNNPSNAAAFAFGDAHFADFGPLAAQPSVRINASAFVVGASSV